MRASLRAAKKGTSAGWLRWSLTRTCAPLLRRTSLTALPPRPSTAPTWAASTSARTCSENNQGHEGYACSNIYITGSASPQPEGHRAHTLRVGYEMLPQSGMPTLGASPAHAPLRIMMATITAPLANSSYGMCAEECCFLPCKQLRVLSEGLTLEGGCRGIGESCRLMPGGHGSVLTAAILEGFVGMLSCLLTGMELAACRHAGCAKRALTGISEHLWTEAAPCSSSPGYAARPQPAACCAELGAPSARGTAVALPRHARTHGSAVLSSLAAHAGF